MDKRDFAYWNSNVHEWKVEAGEFTIKVGNSVRDICARATVKISADPVSLDMLEYISKKTSFCYIFI